MMEQKRTTAPIPSVGADERQSSSQNNLSIAQNLNNYNEIDHILTTEGAKPERFASLPEWIKENARFCCWKYEIRDGRKTKVPYQSMTGERARSNDPASFCPFGQAVNVKGYDGLGVGIFDGLCAIDIDHCVEDGVLSDLAEMIVNHMHSYTELSPGGTGIHILFQATDFHYDTEAYYIMNHTSGLEVYVAGATSKYVTVTGNRINDYEFGERGVELSYVLERYMDRNISKKFAAFSARCGVNGGNGVNVGNVANSTEQRLSDDEIVRLASSAANGKAFQDLWAGNYTAYPSHSEADLALCSHLAFWTGKDAIRMDALFRQSGLMRIDKWDRRQSGSTYGQITIQKAISMCTDTYAPSVKPQMEQVDVGEQAAVKPVACDYSDAELDEIIASIEPKQPDFNPFVPLTPQSSDLPLFPIDALPSVLRDYVKAVAEHTQTSPDMSAVIGLGILAVCLQGKFVAEGSPGYTEPLSLYTLTIAPSGERKSGVMKAMTKYLYEFEQDYNQEHAAEVRQNRLQRESLQRQIANLQKKQENKPDEWVTEAQIEVLTQDLEALPELHKKRFFADDCSSEALTSLMAANDGVFSVLSTEGGIFDLMSGRYNNKVNIDVWLKGYCGDAIYVDRKTREAESILHPTLSAVLTVQPSVLEEVMNNQTMGGRGLVARFLYSTPTSRIGHRSFKTEAIPETLSVAYRGMIYRLMNLSVPEEPKHLVLSVGAREMLEVYFDQHEKYLVGEGQAIADWASKYIGTVLRIAGLLHAAEMNEEGSPIITEATMQRAIHIGSYFLAHAQYAYSMMCVDQSLQKAKFVMAKFRKKECNQVKRYDLFKACRGKFFKKLEDFQPTLDLLCEHGYLRVDQPISNGAGRPPDPIVYLNPDAKEA